MPLGRPIVQLHRQACAGLPRGVWLVALAGLVTAATGSYMGDLTLSHTVAFVGAPILGTAVYDRFGAQALWFGIGALGPVLWAAIAALSRRLGPLGGANCAQPGGVASS